MLERIDMDEAIPHHEESRSTFDPSMEVVFLERDQLKGGVAAAVAPIVANEIALLLESDAQIEDRPVEPGDIAVLCRSNNQALAVTDALRELNVPVSLDGGSSVLGTEIASDLSAVLEAALMPGDSSLVRRALLTSLAGVSPYELATMNDETWSEWVSRFRNPSGCHGFATGTTPGTAKASCALSKTCFVARRRRKQSPSAPRHAECSPTCCTSKSSSCAENANSGATR
jgi:hypothetical protein